MSIEKRDADGSDEVQDDPPDLFFTDAYAFRGDYLNDLAGVFKDPGLVKAVVAFAGNVEALRAFAFVPQTVLSGATAHHFLITEAAQAVLGKGTLDDSDLDRLPDVKAKADEILLSGRSLQGGREEVIKVYSHSLLMYNKRRTIPLLYDGFRQILAAQVASAFAAFEIFAKDMWIAAVNHEPLLASGEWFASKTMRIGDFQRYGYDFRKHMGQILADDKKVEFDSLEKLREAYMGAFPKARFPEVFADSDMTTLSEVRNVIAHNAGKADQKFITRMSGNADWNSEFDSFIPIDGRKTRDMTNTAINAAMRIAKGVQKHLSLHAS